MSFTHSLFLGQSFLSLPLHSSTSASTENKYLVSSRAIIGDGDRKRAPLLVLEHRKHTILLNRERVNVGTKRTESLPLSRALIRRAVKRVGQSKKV